jgi:RimJ/RimL family protein N-acetyltransferase
VTDEQQDEPRAPSPETTLRYRGELVRLAAIEPEADAEVFAAWFDDPVSTRLAGFRPVWPMNLAGAKERLEQWAKATPGAINLAARTIADDRLVGGIGVMATAAR